MVNPAAYFCSGFGVTHPLEHLPLPSTSRLCRTLSARWTVPLLLFLGPAAPPFVHSPLQRLPRHQPSFLSRNRWVTAAFGSPKLKAGHVCGHLKP